MTLNELTIRGFGKFHDRTFTFSDGINILYGKNESGKSTLHSFLRAMLFGMERARGRAAKTDFFAHFEPWFGDGAYGGALKFTEAGHVYRLERYFTRNPLDLTIVDETEGREIQEPQAFLSKLLGNLSVTAFDNTVSIGQLKRSTDAGLVNELKNYIANMNTSGNMSLNITKACAYLKDQRRAFERQIVQDAAKNYAANLAEIRKIEETLASPDYVNHISELTEEDSDGLFYHEEPYSGKKLEQRMIITYSPKYAAYQRQIRKAAPLVSRSMRRQRSSLHPGAPGTALSLL